MVPQFVEKDVHELKGTNGAIGELAVGESSSRGGDRNAKALEDRAVVVDEVVRAL
jgi:hypothetical protein